MSAPKEETAETQFSWGLGDDYDCETCGYTWNEADLDLNWNEDGTWMFSYRTGCYGGDSVLSTDDGALEKLEMLLKEVSVYPDWSPDFEKQVRTLLKL